MRVKQFKALILSVVGMYVDYHIPRAAAALTYFLTLSFFPLLICLYNMLGGMFPAAAEIRSFLTGLLPAETTNAIMDFLGYVARNKSGTMLAMALTVLVTSSSAAFRTVDNVTAEMRGASRFSGVIEILFSIAFSLVFLAAFYLSAILIVTGKWFLELVDRHIMFMNISDSWSWARFLLLFLLLFMILTWLYRLTAPRRRRVRLLPGALLAACALVVVSFVFSSVIGVSVRYPLVYGSLASLILMMFWLYVCGIVIFTGNAVNIALERLDPGLN